jgi:hypothetical protein
VGEFFPIKRGDYYFQARNREGDCSPLNIDTTVSRIDNEMFMRIFFDAGEQIDASLEKLPEVITKHYE